MKSDIAKLKQHIEEIQKGIFKIGRNRIAAMPVHTTWELTDSLEQRARELRQLIERLEKAG